MGPTRLAYHSIRSPCSVCPWTSNSCVFPVARTASHASRISSLFPYTTLFRSALLNSPARAQSTAFTYQGQLDDGGAPASGLRSEEHTSELQSLRHVVCRLLLEKYKCRSERPTQSGRCARWVPLDWHTTASDRLVRFVRGLQILAFFPSLELPRMLRASPPSFPTRRSSDLPS